MKYFIVLMLLGFSANAYAVNCKTHKVYCKIVKLQPRINKAKAMKISNIIYRHATAIGVNPMVSVAILNQENRFRNVNTYQIDRKVVEECGEKMCSKTIVETHKVVDMGIAQINIRTAVDYGFDIKRLYDHDVEYALEAHFIILKSKIRMCSKLGVDAWSCYHSATPEYRLKYIKMVSRYL